MKILQEDVILIKENLYLPKEYGAQRLLSEFPDKGWKLGSIDSLLKRIHNMGIFVRQPLTYTWPHLRCDVGLGEGN